MARARSTSQSTPRSKAAKAKAATGDASLAPGAAVGVDDAALVPPNDAAEGASPTDVAALPAQAEAAPKEPSTTPDPGLLTRARTTPLTRDGVETLAKSASPEALEATLSLALEQRDLKAATVLAFGVAAAGTPIDPDHVALLLADLDPRERVPALLRACRGDGLDVMRRALELGQLSHDREAVVAFVASRQLGEPPWPSPWPGLLRSIARHPLGADASVLLGSAILRSGDPHAREIGATAVEAAEESHAGATVTRWLEGWERPLLDALPDTEPPRVVTGYTVRKAIARPGRNDLCHCGSGKKYKRCHAPLDDAEERTAEAPHVDLTRLSATDVEGMRIQEVLGLPLDRLQRPALLAATRQLRAYHRWTDTERALEVLAAQTEGEAGFLEVDELRVDLIEEALRMAVVDVVDRQLAQVTDREALEATLRAERACVRPGPDTLAILEAQAKRGLQGDIDATADVAFALLDHAPALGVLVARGALDPERPQYGDSLLDEIELARDRLELPPFDRFGPLYDTWIEREESVHAREQSLASEVTKLRQEQQGVAREREERKAQIIGLEHELREVREKLERLLHREAVAAPEALAMAAQRASDERALRLTRKLDELKALLAEGHVERSALRERIAALETAQAEAAAPEPAPGAPHEGGDAGADAEFEGQGVDDTTLPARVPTYGRKALEALQALPSKVVRAAVSITGRLGAGDRAAWRDVKRMQGMESVWTARLGIHHRLIFTVTEDGLAVLDVVTRENLLTSLERYR